MVPSRVGWPQAPDCLAFSAGTRQHPGSLAVVAGPGFPSGSGQVGTWPVPPTGPLLVSLPASSWAKLPWRPVGWALSGSMQGALSSPGSEAEASGPDWREVGRQQCDDWGKRVCCPGWRPVGCLPSNPSPQAWLYDLGPVPSLLCLCFPICKMG